MTEFESEYCGWEHGETAYDWSKSNDLVAEHGLIACNECHKQIKKGDTYSEITWNDQDYDDVEQEFGREHIPTRIKNGGVDNIHVMCESCSDLYDSLVASGREPQLDMIHACHDDWKTFVKVNQFEETILNKVYELEKLLRGTSLSDKADTLVDLAEHIRDEIETN